MGINAVVGQPGLQQGFAANLGFVRRNNILNPRPNPMSGTNGRCGDLTRAGFFRNQAECERYFK
jgi:hypothetical protein